MSNQNPSVRQVEGSSLDSQGTTEQIQYVFHFDKMLEGIGAPSTPIDCIIYNLKTSEDVSATNLDGSPALVGYDLTTPLVKDLTKDIRYRLVASVSVGTQVFTAYKDLIGEL